MAEFFNGPKVDLSLNKIADAAQAVKSALDRIAEFVDANDKLVLFDFSEPSLRQADPSRFRDDLRSRGLTAIADGRYVVAYGKAYQERQERELRKSLRYVPDWNWDNDPMRCHEWRIRGRF